MSTVIKVENLSKAYQLGEIGTGTISRDLERWWARVRGKEDPFIRIGETNDRSTKGSSDVVWSLRDINFDIQRGDAVGIIGRNGAGKSTLLKILSRVTAPTTGSVKIKGRVASLLEVGTGFHPELSGRENIFLNGAILGMRKAEIRKHFDAIVDFSGVERYIDTPVKRYSSGMYVRLAFAVAAHLESEILIVDEVLAVGDAEFQKKCLGKMNDVSKGEGRTILFVSHNIQALENLCTKGILLKNGLVTESGPLHYVTQQYSNSALSEKKFHYSYLNEESIIEDAIVKLMFFGLVNTEGTLLNSFSISDEIGVNIAFEVKEKGAKPVATFAVCNVFGVISFMSISPLETYEPGIYDLTAWIPKHLMNDGEFIIKLGITTLNPVTIHVEYEINLTINDVYNNLFRKDYKEKYHGMMRPVIKWKL